MKVAIHQPNFLPWIGYFSKISQCDTFVFLDDVQLAKGFTPRNRLKGPNGPFWLTVPLEGGIGSRKLICDVQIAGFEPWRDVSLKTLGHCYKRAPVFDEVLGQVLAPLTNATWTKLADLNEALIQKILDYLDIHPTLVRSSDLKTAGQSTERLVSICRALGADTYLSGFGGRSYQDPHLFDAAGIKLEVYDFKHPVYPQLWGAFEENLSVIDLLFNCGKEGREIIDGSKI
jgi:hypothetical protein